jgi:predicted transcriptional regulator
MEAKDDLRSQIVALRQAGRSRSEIQETLGPISTRLISDALRGTPPPEWTRRPRAKDDLHAEARKLRTEGMGYNEIAAQLGVSKSTVSAWVHDLPALTQEQRHKNAVVAQQRFRERERAYRDDMRAVAASEIGHLSDRETIIAGAIAYWCEGSKTKPWSAASDRVTFINSDPGLVRFFLRFLDVAGVERTDLIFRVHIHESADVAAAERFWAELTGAPADQFRRATLKRHNPKTVRKNVYEDYRGCLIIYVRRSGNLYREIEGWMSAITFG